MTGPRDVGGTPAQWREAVLALAEQCRDDGLAEEAEAAELDRTALDPEFGQRPSATANREQATMLWARAETHQMVWRDLLGLADRLDPRPGVPASERVW